MTGPENRTSQHKEALLGAALLAISFTYHRTGKRFKYDLHIQLGCLKFRPQGIYDRKKGCV
jgi:hypothetical protein